MRNLWSGSTGLVDVQVADKFNSILYIIEERRASILFIYSLNIFSISLQYITKQYGMFSIDYTELMNISKNYIRGKITGFELLSWDFGI